MQADHHTRPSPAVHDTASSQAAASPVHVNSLSSQKDAERSRWVTRSGALRV